MKSLGEPEDPGAHVTVGDPISEDKVKQAIRKCTRGKSAGPDELRNDWYRDSSVELVPILTELFNIWVDGGCLLSSFGMANVHCLKTTNLAAAPLEHRPLALLNTDYKLLMWIFATRHRQGSNNRSTRCKPASYQDGK